MVSRNTWYIGIAIVAVVLIAAGLYYSGMIGAPTKYDLTIQVTGQGTTNPAAGTQSTNSGTVVVVTATPATGWDFVNWQLNGQNSTTNPISVTVTANSVLKAFFKPEPPPVMSKWSLAIQVQGQGTTNPAAGVTQVNNAESVTITPTPAASWVFDHWVINGQNSTTTPLTLTMTTDYSITAVFKLTGPPVMARWSLAVQIEGQGMTSPPPGITQVTNANNVTITASPAVSWVFDHWVVNGQNMTTNPLTMKMDNDYSVTAVFKLGGPPVMGRWSLAIQVEGQGTTSPAPGITQVTNANQVTITASPAASYVFDHWVINGQNSMQNPLTLTMDTDYSVTAVFTLGGPPVMGRWSLAIQVVGQGTTNPGAGITQVTNGATVVITPTAASYWVFDHWVVNGQNQTTTPLTLTMNTDYSVTAVFKVGGPPVMSRWSLAIAAEGGGTTNPVPGVMLVPTDTVVTVTAIPDTGKVFDHWVLNGVNMTANPIAITMTTDYSLTAVFR